MSTPVRVSSCCLPSSSEACDDASDTSEKGDLQ